MIPVIFRYVNLALLLPLAVVLIVLLVKAAVLARDVDLTAEKGNKVREGIDASSQKLARIRQSSGSFSFFGAVLAILLIIKETIFGRKKTLGGSFVSSLARHSSQIRKIRL